MPSPASSILNIAIEADVRAFLIAQTP